MATRDTTQLAQPVAVTATLPSLYPELPAAVLKRFPEMEAYHREQERLYKRIREALRATADDLALPINRTTNDTTDLFARYQNLNAAITSERTLRITADSALAATISSLIVSGGGGARVYVQATAPVGASLNDLWFDDDDGFRAYYWNGTAWVDASDTRIAFNLAAITTEQTARITADGALASVSTSIIARLNTGDIATAISSLTSSVSTLNGLVTANSTLITTLTSRLNTGDIATALSTLTTNVSTLNGQVSANATSVTAISARLNTGDIATAISSLTVAVGPTGTLSTRIDALAAGSGNHIYRQGTAPSGANIGDYWIDSSNGNLPSIWNGSAWVDVTDASLTAVIGTVSTISSTFASTSYVTSSISTSATATLASANGYTNGQISGLSSVYATPTSVTASISSAIATEVTNRNTAITSSASTLTTAYTAADATLNTALSGRISTLESQVQTPTTGLLARVTTVESTYATTSAVSASISTAISAEITNRNTAISASVSTEASARATADGFLASKYTLQVIAGNVVTGMNITSSTGSGTNVSTIIFQASDFLIYDGSSAGIATFAVSGGIVYAQNMVIDGSLLVNGTITAAKMNVTSLSAISADLGTVTAGTLSSGTTFAGALSAATGTFAGALSAATGTFAGNLSAAGGTFSGALSAATGTFAGNLSAAGGTFAGALSAASGTFSGDISGSNGTFSGTLSGVGGTFTGALSGATGTFAGALSAATGSFAGNLSAAGGTFAGALSAATGTFSGDISAASGTFTGTVSCTNSTTNSVTVSGAGITMGAYFDAHGFTTATVFTWGTTSSDKIYITGTGFGGNIVLGTAAVFAIHGSGDAELHTVNISAGLTVVGTSTLAAVNCTSLDAGPTGTVDCAYGVGFGSGQHWALTFDGTYHHLIMNGTDYGRITLF